MSNQGFSSDLAVVGNEKETPGMTDQLWGWTLGCSVAILIIVSL